MKWVFSGAGREGMPPPAGDEFLTGSIKLQQEAGSRRGVEGSFLEAAGNTGVSKPTADLVSV